MASGNPKVSILLELKERIKGGLDNAKRLVSDSVRGMKKDLADLKNSANNSLGGLKNSLRNFKLSHIEAFKNMKAEIPGFGRAMELLGNPYVLVFAGLTALVAMYGKAVQMSLEWEKSMAKVNVTAQLNKKELKDLSTQLRTIGARNATDLMQVPEAFNRIVSAGLDVNTSLKVLEPTLQAAKAGFTDVETVAAAAVGVMNSSEVKDINTIYDILFATLNKGNAEFADIAAYLPKIVPTARNVGVTLQDTAGTFAYFTAQGLQAERAATLLENAFKVLGSPDKVKKFKELGISIYDAKGQMLPLVNVAEQLNKKLEGLSDKDKSRVLASLDLDMEAASAFAVMSQDVDKLRDNIDFVNNSAGQLNEAVKNSKTSMDSWTIIGNQFKAVMLEVGDTGVAALGELGEAILPDIQQLLTDIQDPTSAIGEWFAIIRDVVFAVGDGLGHVLGAVLSIVKGVVSWLLKFELLRDIFWIIGKVAEGVWFVIGKIGDGIKWIWENVLAPVLDALNTAYKWVKEFLGLGGEDKHVKISVNDKETTAKIGDMQPPPSLMPTQAGTRTLADNGIKLKDDKKAGNDSTTRVTGRQDQVKNITINMEAFFKGDFLSKQADISKMSKKEFEQWLLEIFNRFLANLETSYS